MRERVCWQILKFDKGGGAVRHCEGAQSVFGLKRAQSIVKLLGKGWSIRHMADPLQEPPDEEK